MSINIEEIVIEIEKEKRKSRFDGEVRVEKRENMINGSNFSGCINFDKEITLRFNPSYEEKKPGKTKKIIIDIERHEINHVRDVRVKKGCPENLENHLVITEQVANVLKPKGYNDYDVQYVTNAFEDFIDNVNLSTSFDLEGLIRFYEDVGECCETGKYTEFYEAFVRLQAMFWNHPLKKILNKFYTHDSKTKPQIRETLENFLKRSKLNLFKKTIKQKDREIVIRDRESMINHINNEKIWPELAKIFTEEFIRLMKPSYALPIPGLSGNKTKGKEDYQKSRDFSEGDKKNSEESREEGIKWEEFEEGNFFDQEMHDARKRKEQAFKRFKKGEDLPNWLNYYEALDSVYEKISKRLNIKAEVFTKTTQMPITWYGKKNFDPNRDKPKHLIFDFNDEGDVVLKRKKWSCDINLEYKIAEKGFPEVKFIIMDTSDSMKSSPENDYDIGSTNYIPWGDNSKYHYALIAWYGFIEYLRQNHLLKKTKISIANFSSTLCIGRGIEEAKKIALTPQFGETYLDVERIQNIARSRGNLIFTISDGEINNWDEIKDEFVKLMNNNYYFHLQIGDSNQVTSDLESNGFPVYYVKGKEDLWQKVIEISEFIYRKKPKGEKSK